MKIYTKNVSIIVYQNFRVNFIGHACQLTMSKILKEILLHAHIQITLDVFNDAL